MKDDPILAELYRFREELAARFNYDVEALAAYLREEQVKEGRTIVSFSPKRIEPEGEALLPEKQAA
jgi:hypothetical protein